MKVYGTLWIAVKSVKTAKGVEFGKLGREELISLTPIEYVVPVVFRELVDGFKGEIEKFTVWPVHNPTELDTPPAT